MGHHWLLQIPRLSSAQLSPFLLCLLHSAWNRHLLQEGTPETVLLTSHLRTPLPGLRGLHLPPGKLFCGSPQAPHTWFSLMSPTGVGALLAIFPNAGVWQSILKCTPQTLWGSHSKGSLQNLQRLLSPHRFNRFRPPPQVPKLGAYSYNTQDVPCALASSPSYLPAQNPSLLFTWVVVTCFSEFSSNDSSQG